MGQAGAVRGKGEGLGDGFCRVVKEDPSGEVIFELRSGWNRSCQWEDVEEEGTQRWFLLGSLGGAPPSRNR